MISSLRVSRVCCRPETAVFRSGGSRRFNSAIPLYHMHQRSPLDDVLSPSAPSPLFGTTNPPQQQSKRTLLKCGVPEEALRFKTTSYGRLWDAPFVSPNEHRVVLKVDVDKLPLNQMELDILKEIVGGRFSEEHQELRLQSVQFGSRIENKRHLVSMLDRLILASKRLAGDVVKQQQQQQQT